MKITKRNRKGFTLVELLVVMAIIAVLASIATPLILNKRKDADRTKAVGHLTQIKLAVTQFQNDHGLRPGEKVAPDIDNAKASNANEVCRMMIQGLPDVRSEAIFFAPSKLSRKPDDDIGESPSFTKACEKGEVGFLYVDSPDAKDGAPLFAAPLATADGKLFDYDAYNGKAVVLKTDGTVDTLNIDEDSEKVNIKVSGSEVDMFSSSNKAFRTAPKILPILER